MYDNSAYAQYYRRRDKRRELLKKYAKIAAAGISIYVFFAIVFPFSACGCVRENARRASCQSNMKQLGFALAMYTQDSDGDLPPIVEASAKRTWRETLYPYVKSTGVYRCPDDPYSEGPNTLNDLSWSYAANHTGWRHMGNENRVITLVDVRGDDGAEWDMTNPSFLPKSGWFLYTHKPNHAFYQHPSGTINCLFSDGHVKAMQPMATLTPVNLWTRDNAPFTGQDLSNAQAILRHVEAE